MCWIKYNLSTKHTHTTTKGKTMRNFITYQRLIGEKSDSRLTRRKGKRGGGRMKSNTQHRLLFKPIQNLKNHSIYGPLRVSSSFIGCHICSLKKTTSWKHTHM